MNPSGFFVFPVFTTAHDTSNIAKEFLRKRIAWQVRALIDALANDVGLKIRRSPLAPPAEGVDEAGQDPQALPRESLNFHLTREHYVLYLNLSSHIIR